MALDAVGIVLARMAFDQDPGLEVFNMNFFRSLAAVSILFPYLVFRNNTAKTIGLEDIKQHYGLVLAPIFGTFIALSFYIQAVKTGSLMLVTAIGVTGPLISGFFEFVIDKIRPTKSFLFALLLFIIGMGLRVYLIAEK